MTAPISHSGATPTDRGIEWFRTVKVHRNLLLSAVCFFALLAAVSLANGRAPSYFGVSTLLTSATSLALGAIGETIVVIGGGLDLSVGAIVSLTQAIQVVYFSESPLPAIVLVLIGVFAGMAAGAINGFFVSIVRLQPIIVTLSTMFALRGLTLLILPRPGGTVPDSLSALLLDDKIPGMLPGPVVVLLAAVCCWGLLKKTNLGTTIFASGSDRLAARTAGMPVDAAVWASYIGAGGMYGLAGSFVAAQSGAGDPLVGNAMLVPVLTAIMLGGASLGGGRGTTLGSMFGALTIILMVNFLLVMGVPDYLSAAIEALVLLLALLINQPRGSYIELRRLAVSLKRQSRRTVRGKSTDRLLGFSLPTLRALLPPADRRTVVPAWAGLAIFVVAASVYYGHAFEPLRYLNQLLVLGAFLAVLVLGQGAVIIGGGFDLSIGWCITASGVIASMLMQGSDRALLWASPAVLAFGALVGCLNGLLVALLGLPPIVATLAMGGMLQSFCMFLSGGTPTGDASPLLRWFVITGDIGGVAPLSIAIFAFAFIGTLVLSVTPFARRLLAVGNNPRAALLSGVRVRNVVLGSYALSGVCSGLAGLLLTGFLGRSSLTLGDNYLLPTVAAVAVGGTLITGGRGHYLGLFGGALMLTALQILLSGTSLPPAMRDIFLGFAVMAAVISLREK